MGFASLIAQVADYWTDIDSYWDWDFARGFALNSAPWRHLEDWLSDLILGYYRQDFAMVIDPKIVLQPEMVDLSLN